LVEKTIDLKDIELVQFLGVKNKNIQGIEEAFPKTKIISRGNKISIKGNKDQLLEVEKIITSLISHFDKYGSVNIKVVQSHIRDGYSNQDNEPIVYGSNGKRIVAKTKNQKKIVNLHKKNDLLFVIGPAGTGKTYVSVALGVKALKEKKVKKIIITRPVVEAC
jgi:phosphate starvation-inducible PhoH-like protein